MPKLTVADLRPEMAAFAVEMEEALRRHELSYPEEPGEPVAAAAANRVWSAALALDDEADDVWTLTERIPGGRVVLPDEVRDSAVRAGMFAALIYALHPDAPKKDQGDDEDR
jgi:hypothetical protein